MKKFRYLFVGMLRLMNNICILYILALQLKAIHGDLFQMNHNEFKLYIINDKGYRLMFQLMIPHK